MNQNSMIESKEVSWVVDGITVYGTLTKSLVTDTNNAVIFVAGSGPTDRDWCSPLLPGTNGSAKLIAEELSRRGFITLRYDKRASGPHVRENIAKLIGKISMKSHTDELKGAVKTILSQTKSDSNSIFALTNSEGAIHALNYQVESTLNRFKGLILTGAPGRPIGQVARTQMQNQLKSLANADDILKSYDSALASFVSGKPVEPDPSLPEGMRMLLQSLATPANLPFARELWTYDASAFISKVPEPALIMIGKKDIQVDWKADGKALEEATIGKENVSFSYPENADHVLKYEEKPREKILANAALRYNAEDRVLDPEALKTILEWLSRFAK
jgi:uncharacterized protein